MAIENVVSSIIRRNVPRVVHEAMESVKVLIPRGGGTLCKLTRTIRWAIVLSTTSHVCEIRKEVSFIFRANDWVV